MAAAAASTGFTGPGDAADILQSLAKPLWPPSGTLVSKVLHSIDRVGGDH